MIWLYELAEKLTIKANESRNFSDTCFFVIGTYLFYSCV